jgi:hypothetical protein
MRKCRKKIKVLSLTIQVGKEIKTFPIDQCCFEDHLGFCTMCDPLVVECPHHGVSLSIIDGETQYYIDDLEV